jgi:hypothetical protein
MFWLIFGNRRPQMQRRYITVDVFTDRAFGGNPLAVVLDAGGLSTAQMQAIVSEFNYSETTFVLPPRDPAHDERRFASSPCAPRSRSRAIPMSAPPSCWRPRRPGRRRG